MNGYDKNSANFWGWSNNEVVSLRTHPIYLAGMCKITYELFTIII
jgi:hypothetical protein